MLGDEGVKFYTFLVKLTQNQNFSACAEYLPQPEKEKKGEEELVLRFFASKNARDLFRGSVRDWLDNYMEEVLLGTKDFAYESEEDIFLDVFKLAKQKLGDTAFLRYRGGSPVGSLPPAYFEAISIGIANVRNKIRGKNPEILRQKLSELVQSEDFRAVTGPGANSRDKLETRIRLVGEVLGNA